MKKELLLPPLMTMILLFFVCTAYLSSCTESYTSNENQVPQHQEMQEPVQLKIDTSLIAILPLKSPHDWIFENTTSPAELTNDDLKKIETLLADCIYEYNPKQEKKFEEIQNSYPKQKLDKDDYIIDLKNYRRQYIPVINSKGEKEVWVNCFCHSNDPKWKEEISLVNDGGNCYFNVKINLTTGKYYNLMVNGWA